MSKLKGLWIPLNILLNEELSDKEKIVLSMISYLSDETGSCFASNKYIASIVNVTSDRASKIVSSLKKKGYIEVKLKFRTESKEVESRQIILNKEKLNGYSEKYLEGIGENNYLDSQKQLHPIGENNEDIINNIKNKNNYNKGALRKKNNKANFEQRDYTDFDFTKLYATTKKRRKRKRMGFGNIRANKFICSYNYYFICFNANSQADTTKPLKE